jgi:hypothetical protein
VISSAFMVSGKLFGIFLTRPLFLGNCLSKKKEIFY